MRRTTWPEWLLGAWIASALAVAGGAVADARAALPVHPPLRVLSADTPLAPPPIPGPVPPARPRPVAVPVAVRAPAAGIDARLVPVGKTADGELAVPPFGQAGWYDLGPRPGQPGRAVLAGHVDSVSGPDVFFGLRDLRPGDAIEVALADGGTLTFRVEGLEEIAKDQLPTERVFGSSDAEELRLVTCGGEFDRASGHYTANVIVYARLDPATPPG